MSQPKHRRTRKEERAYLEGLSQGRDEILPTVRRLEGEIKVHETIIRTLREDGRRDLYRAMSAAGHALEYLSEVARGHR